MSEAYLEGAVVLAAGGTGGHIFPAEALAEALIAAGHKVVLVTDKRFANYNSKAREGIFGEIPIHYIRANSLGGSIFSKCKNMIGVGIGIVQARKILKQIKPAAVVGFGGYPSFPTMMAACQLGLPTVIHEQNSVLGRANRVLASRVKRIALSYKETKRLPQELAGRTALTGNPVRGAIKALNNVPYSSLSDDAPMRILVLGGSQGATVFSDVVPEAVAMLPEALRNRVRLDQQCRKADMDATKARYAELGVNADLATFFTDVPARMASAHLLICRAGASTLAEVTTAGRPAILVPYPDATDQHQLHNAQMVEDVGGGWVMPQEGFTAEALANKLESFLTLPGALEKAAALVRKVGMPGAADALAGVVYDVAGASQPKSLSAAAVPTKEAA